MSRRSPLHYAGVYISMAIGVGIVSYRTFGSFSGAIIVALATSLSAGYFLIRLDRKAGARLEDLSLSDGDYPPRISATGVVKASPEQAMAVCLEGVKSLPNFGRIKKFEPGKSIHARTRTSRSSWGEKITIHALQTSDGTQLHLKSVPVLWTVTQDMKSNYQNVALVLRHIDGVFKIGRLEPSEYFGGLFIAKRLD